MDSEFRSWWIGKNGAQQWSKALDDEGGALGAIEMIFKAGAATQQARIEALENPTIKRQEFAAKMLATFTQPDVDCYLLAGIIYTAMQEPKMAAALLKETNHE